MMRRVYVAPRRELTATELAGILIQKGRLSSDDLPQRVRDSIAERQKISDQIIKEV